MSMLIHVTVDDLFLPHQPSLANLLDGSGWVTPLRSRTSVAAAQKSCSRRVHEYVPLFEEGSELRVLITRASAVLAIGNTAPRNDVLIEVSAAEKVYAGGELGKRDQGPDQRRVTNDDP